MTINISSITKGNTDNIVKGKYPLYIGNSVSEIELDSIQRIGNSNEVSLGFKIADEKVINMIK